MGCAERPAEPVRAVKQKRTDRRACPSPQSRLHTHGLWYTSARVRRSLWRGDKRRKSFPRTCRPISANSGQPPSSAFGAARGVRRQDRLREEIKRRGTLWPACVQHHLSLNRATQSPRARIEDRAKERAVTINEKYPSPSFSLVPTKARTHTHSTSLSG